MWQFIDLSKKAQNSLSYQNIIYTICYILNSLDVEQICSLALGETCGEKINNPLHQWDVKFPDVKKPSLKKFNNPKVRILPYLTLWLQSNQYFNQLVEVLQIWFVEIYLKYCDIFISATWRVLFIFMNIRSHFKYVNAFWPTLSLQQYYWQWVVRGYLCLLLQLNLSGGESSILNLFKLLFWN